MAVKLTNNASSTLVGAIGSGDTTLAIAAPDAASFPALSGGDWFPLTVVDGVGNLEIMKCTARSSNTLTVVRGQEGTTARAFSAGARAEVRLTAAVLNAFPLGVDIVTAAAAFGADTRIIIAHGDEKSVKASEATLDEGGNAGFVAIVAASLALKDDTMEGDHVRRIYIASAADGDYDIALVVPNGHITATLQPGSYTLAALNIEGQPVAGGGAVTSKELATMATGTQTVDVSDRPQQHYVNNGAHALAPAAAHGACYVDITNGASAGAISTVAFTTTVGQFTTTPGHKFRCGVSVGPAGSLLQIQPL